MSRVQRRTRFRRMGSLVNEPPIEQWDDATLVDGIRRKQNRALRAFFRRFHAPLVGLASRMGVPGGEREEVVTEFLDDVALWLMEAQHRTPRVLATYLGRGLRHRILNRARGDARRRQYEVATADATEGWEFDSTHSERIGAVAERGDDSFGPLSAHLRRLSEVLEAAVTEPERELAVMMANRTGPTEIGRRLGISREAAKARMHRLRRKLSGIVVSSAVTAEERRQLLAMFGDTRRLSPLDRRLLIGERDMPPDAA